MQNLQKVIRARSRIWLKFCTVASICTLFMKMKSFWLKLIFSVFSRGGPPGGHFSPVSFLILEQVWLLQSLTLCNKNKIELYQGKGHHSSFRTVCAKLQKRVSEIFSGAPLAATCPLNEMLQKVDICMSHFLEKRNATN